MAQKEKKINPELSEERANELKQQILENLKAYNMLKEAGQSQSILDDILNQTSSLEKQLYVIGDNKVNASKHVYNGVEYDSTREANFARALDKAGYKYQSQVEIVLQEGFEMQSEKVRPIKMIVDFQVGNVFIDIKGFVFPEFKIKWKMLKNKFRDERLYLTAKNNTEINGVMQILKYYHE